MYDHIIIFFIIMAHFADKCKIRFLGGESDKLSNNTNFTTTIILVKENPIYHGIILHYTYITSILVDIVIEYVHELLLIETEAKIKNNDLYVTLTLKDNFSITLRIWSKSANIYWEHTNQSILKLGYKYSNTSVVPSDNPVIINVFINYYMKYYYGYDKYINNISSITDLCSTEQLNSYMTNDIFYQFINKSANSYYKVITTHNHEKVTHMILIIKLFIDLLTQKN